MLCLVIIADCLLMLMHRRFSHHFHTVLDDRAMPPSGVRLDPHATALRVLEPSVRAPQKMGDIRRIFLDR